MLCSSGTSGAEAPYQWSGGAQVECGARIYHPTPVEALRWVGLSTATTGGCRPQSGIPTANRTIVAEANAVTCSPVEHAE